MVYCKKSKKLDLERYPPTSSSTLLHIKRASLQSHVWLRSPFAKSLVIDPLQYGYKLQEDDDEDDEVMKPNIMVISLRIYQNRASVESVQEQMYAFAV